MRVACPSCGERGSDEFSIHGDAAPRRPLDGGATPTPEWADYVYLRDNPAGRLRELWYHAAGCRTWLVLTRDTRNHAILEVQPARDVAIHEAARGSST